MRVLIGYMIDGRNSGIDKYLLRVLALLRGEDVQADVLTTRMNEDLRQILAGCGAELIEVPSLRHPLRQYAAVKRLTEENRYDLAYFNISEAVNSVGALAARKGGAGRVAVHSHNSGPGGSGAGMWKLRIFLNTCLRPLASAADEYYACSELAGRWLFSKKARASGRYHIIYNPVSLETFAYREEVRRQMRKALGVEDAVVIGHIGNYIYSKNSGFLPEILQAVRERIPGAVLLSVGDGPERAAVMEKAAAMGLGDSMIFLGVRDDVPRLLQAMDVFVLPSRFEGLPIAAIEAQMSGLKTFFSERITEEAAIDGQGSFLPIDRGADLWGAAIAAALPYERPDLTAPENRSRTARFDIEEQASAIRAIFLSKEEDEG